MNSVILDQASKLLQLSEAILQCSKSVKEDMYPAANTEAGATPTYRMVPDTLFLSVRFRLLDGCQLYAMKFTNRTAL